MRARNEHQHEGGRDEEARGVDPQCCRRAEACNENAAEWSPDEERPCWIPERTPDARSMRTPASTIGRKLKKTTSAVSVALPVVVSTYQGIAICATALPAREMRSAA